MLPLIATVVLSSFVPAAPAAGHSTSVAIRPAPSLSKKDRVLATRLHAFIMKKQAQNPRRRKEVNSYAAILAERIVVEARRNHLSVAAFAAIAWNESWYWWRTAGTSHEFGVWQIWPYGSAVAQEWEYLRRKNRIGSFPDKKWKRLGYNTRRFILKDVMVSTALAARILRRLVLWCKARHRVYKTKLLGSRRHHHWTDRYAHYNSGTSWPHPVYYYQLRRHTRKIQAVLTGN